MIGAGREIPDWLDVSRETAERLVELESLVLKWTQSVNLISRATIPHIWERHILDSAQIGRIAGPDGQNWADFGSGGGFPALVLAAMAKEHLPLRRFTLIESDARKAAFLTQAVRTLELPAAVLVDRAERVRPIGADVVTARALAPLSDLLGLAARHLGSGARAFFPKGASHQDEVGAARQRWRFDVTAHKSMTEAAAAILEVTNIAPL